jgi:hypothetical protein
MLTISRMAARPSVHIPAPEADKPSWLRVGVVALIGFAIGVAWPKVAGVKIGPSAPAEAVSAALASASRAAESASAMASASAPVAIAAPAVSAAPAANVSVTVGKAAILSCKTEEGESLKGKDCGWLTGLDPLIQTRLKRLAQLPATAENPGKLNVILGLDFKNNRISVESGKSSTVKDVDSLKAFIAGEVKSMSLKPVDHQNERYSVLYVVNISNGSSEAAPSAAGSSSGATTNATATATTTTTTQAPQAALPDGTAAVAWETAIVRDAPHTGAIVAHLPRGTKVQLGSSEGGWYKIKFGPSFSSDGWVYRGAIGK